MNRYRLRTCFVANVSFAHLFWAATRAHQKRQFDAVGVRHAQPCRVSQKAVLPRLSFQRNSNVI